MDLAHYVDAHGLYGRHGFAALDTRGRRLLAHVPRPLGDVLEIGAGDGLLSLWLLHAGARRVVSLEPEASGSTHGVGARAAEHRRHIGVGERWVYLPQTFQEWRADRPFQLVLSYASINHLDEDACVRLLDDPAARARYRELFGKIRSALAPGGSFVFTDVARRNFWASRKLASPWAPEIEWHKHQEPETWLEVATEAGLEPIDAHWQHPFVRVGRLGDALLNLEPVARLLVSGFIATVRRA